MNNLIKSVGYISYIILFVITGIILTPSFAAAGERLLIIPFNIHSQGDLSYLEKGIFDMLSTRLSQSGKVKPLPKDVTYKAISNFKDDITLEKAIDTAKRLNVSYVVYGSLTVFGDSISTDARFVDVNENKTLVTFNRFGENKNAAIKHINEFANGVNKNVFGIITGPTASEPVKPVVKRPEQVKAPAMEDTRKHPNKIWKESRKQGQGPSLAPSQSFEKPSVDPTDLFVKNDDMFDDDMWKSRSMNMEILSMSSGDFDGDDISEVVLVAKKNLMMYRIIQGRLQKMGETDFTGNESPVAIDVADIDQNGKEEIYVTCMSERWLKSFILEWNGTRFIPIADSERWYLRVVFIPGRGKVLFGQKQGIDELFSKGISELKLNGGELVSVNDLELPRNVNIFEFTIGDLVKNGVNDIVRIQQSGHLALITPGGSREWESEERYGGGNRYIDYLDEDAAAIGEYHETKRYYVPQRMIIKDIDGDGVNELLVVKNNDRVGRLVSKFRLFASGQIECFIWDRFGLTSKWKTRKFTKFISDYSISDINGDGVEELIFSVVANTDDTSDSPKSYIAVLKLPTNTP